MFVNADCTVFNKRYNQATRSNTWYRTHLKGVYMETSIGTSRDKTSGITENSNLFLSIPSDADSEGREFVDPNEYKTASPEAVFTFAPDDIVVKGIVPEMIGNNFTIADLQRKYSTYVVTECRDLRYGGLPHLEVSGK